MNEFLLHIVGDYLLQNDWMATQKTKGGLVALLHAVIYTLPFLLVTQNLWAIAIIGITHFFIDRFRLAIYWIKTVNWSWDTPLGYAEERPDYLKVWLVIFVDNTFHLLINHFALML